MVLSGEVARSFIKVHSSRCGSRRILWFPQYDSYDYDYTERDENGLTAIAEQQQLERIRHLHGQKNVI
jgi:hypothetical protein